MAKTIPEFPTQFDLGAFLSRESHDLKTPFNHIVGFSRIVLKGQDGPLTDFQREDLTTVYNSGVRALFLLSSLIEIARICQGKKELSLAEVEAAPFVEQTLAQWRKSNPARDIQIEVKLATAVLYADETLLRQAISSLASYVTEYVQDAAQVSFALTEESDGWVTTIQSAGRKSPNPSRLDLDMLGYIGRANIEQHGGEIRVQDETDDGAMISFTLPKQSGVKFAPPGP